VATAFMVSGGPGGVAAALARVRDEDRVIYKRDSGCFSSRQRHLGGRGDSVAVPKAGVGAGPSRRGA
jgi:hypothetical protein